MVNSAVMKNQNFKKNCKIFSQYKLKNQVNHVVFLFKPKLTFLNENYHLPKIYFQKKWGPQTYSKTLVKKEILNTITNKKAVHTHFFSHIQHAQQ